MARSPTRQAGAEVGGRAAVWGSGGDKGEVTLVLTLHLVLV